MFGIRDFELIIRERSDLTEANITKLEEKGTHVYPLPGWLAHLVVPGNVTDNEQKSLLAHPAFIENLTETQLFKMFKFGLWAKHKSKMEGGNKTLSDVIKEELTIFEENGFDLRENFQVGIYF